MPKYTFQDLVSAAEAAGFQGIALVRAVAVAIAEAGFSGEPNHNRNGSIDRGPWQFNNRSHPEVSDACANDLYCAARQAFRVSKGGTDWREWVTWLNGSAQRIMQTMGNQIGGLGNQGPVRSSPAITAPVAKSPLFSASNPCAGIDCSALNWSGCIKLALCDTEQLALRVLYNGLLLGVVVLGVYLLFREEIDTGVKTAAKVAVAA